MSRCECIYAAFTYKAVEFFPSFFLSPQFVYTELRCVVKFLSTFLYDWSNCTLASFAR